MRRRATAGRSRPTRRPWTSCTRASSVASPGRSETASSKCTAAGRTRRPPRSRTPSFDWVYVDGNHLYDYVRSDLALYDPKVKPGGLIAGDDYGDAGWWEDGVTRAVDEFVAERGYEVVSLAAHQFVLRKPGRHQSIVK